MKNQAAKGNYFVFVFMIGAIVGTFFSALLIQHHVEPSTSGLVGHMCGTGSDNSCAIVNQSTLSTLFGMPIAFWGFLFYGAALLTSVFYYFLRESFLLQKMLWMAFFGVAVDLVLLGYSVFSLGTVCRMCAVTYIASLLMLIGAWFTISEKKGEISMIPSLSNAKNISARVWTVFALLFITLPVSGWYLSQKSGSVKDASAAHHADPKVQKMFEAAFEDYYKAYKESPEVKMNAPEAPFKGNKNAKLELVEFADPLCPYCALYAVKLKELVNRYPDKIKVSYRHYPLDKNCNSAMQNQLHAGACELAYAKVCAGEQGKFWEMHDNLFAAQAKWSKGVTIPQLGSTASDLGLDEKKFLSCVNSPATRARVEADLKAGNAAGVTGTPSLFANGRKMPGLRVEFFDFFMAKFIEREAGR